MCYQQNLHAQYVLQSKFNLIAPIFKRLPGYDPGLLHAVTTNIKGISFFQILLERAGYQVEVFMKDRLCGSIKSDAGIRVPVGLLPNPIGGNHARTVNSLPSISLPSNVIPPFSSTSCTAIACGVNASSCTT